MSRVEIEKILGVDTTNLGIALIKLEELEFVQKADNRYILTFLGEKMVAMIKNGGEITNEKIEELGLRKWKEGLVKHGPQPRYITEEEITEGIAEFQGKEEKVTAKRLRRYHSALYWAALSGGIK